MSDIERLAQQYSKNIESMTGQYQQSFADYQKMVAERMAPYESEVKRYQTELMPAFESQKSQYQSKLDAYNVTLAEIAKDPLIAKTGTRTVAKPYYDPFTNVFSYYPAQETYTYYEKKPIPKFTETAPKAPSAPVRPAIAEFDTSQFAAKKAETESAFKREVGERKAARLGAVSRRATRPMLQET
jgi:hypothetical protein